MHMRSSHKQFRNEAPRADTIRNRALAPSKPSFPMFMCTKPPRGQILARPSTSPAWTKYFVNAESPGLLLLYKGYLSRKLETVIHLGNASLHQELNKQHHFEIRCVTHAWYFKARHCEVAEAWFQYICHSMVLYARLELESQSLQVPTGAPQDKRVGSCCAGTTADAGTTPTSQCPPTVDDNLVLTLTEDLLYPEQKCPRQTHPFSPRVSLLPDVETLEPENSTGGGWQGLFRNKQLKSLRTSCSFSREDRKSRNSARSSGKENSLVAA